MTLSGSLAPSVSGRKEVVMPPNKQRNIEIRYGYWNKKVKVDTKEKVTVMLYVKGAHTFRSEKATESVKSFQNAPRKEILPLRLWHAARHSKSSRGGSISDFQLSVFDN